MANALADNAKSILRDRKLDELENVLQIEAFESIALPEYEKGLERYRAALFGLGGNFDERALANALTLRGGQIAETLAAIETLKDNAVPRSKIYDLLRIAKEQENGFLSDGTGSKADVDLAAEARKYLKRMGRDEDEGLAQLRILGKDVPLAYTLAVISGLWDYVNPLANLPAKRAAGNAA